MNAITMKNQICLAFRWLLALVFAVALALFSSPVFAGSAQWQPPIPGIGDWNTAGNWNPATVPNAAADVATFATSAITGVSLSADTEVNGIVFNSGASAFTITVSPGFVLTVSGAGITNNSGITQNFVADVNGAGSFGGFRFTNSATAGINTAFTMKGSAFGSPFGSPFAVFLDSSTAGSGSFTNNGGTASGGNGGATVFRDGSSASSGTFINNGGTMSGALGGTTEFHGSSTAFSGTFTNNGGAFSGAAGGVTRFFNTATAFSGTFTNNGATLPSAVGGATEFHDSSNAGNGTFITNGGNGPFAPNPGVTKFLNSSSAANGTFTTNGGTVSGAVGGFMLFKDTSNAGSGTFTTNGGTMSGAQAGITEFDDTSTADSGTFTNNGGAFSGAGGSGMLFENTSKAINATITNNGGTTTGAFGGGTFFHTASEADNATLIANGGTGGGFGGRIVFQNDSTGGTARVEVFGNGHLDISPHNAPGVTIGSIEGSGNVFLGARTLTVGSNNLSTTFSGVIQDGGTGGSLEKIGSGTLILSGNNTYTGNTFIQAGVLQVDGSIVSPATFVNLAGTLSGTGTVGDGSAGGGVNNAGVVSPGDSPGTLTINGDYGQQGVATLRIEIGGVAPAQHDLLAVGGQASVSGTLQLIRLDDFRPGNGQRVTIITDAGGHVGMYLPVDPVNWGLIKPVPMYDETNDIYVVFELSAPFSSQAFTPNQMSVAKELDEVANDSRAADLIAFLGSEPMGNLPHDYDLIAPEELASIYEIGFSQAVVTNMNLQHRMDDIRAGSTGFCGNGYQARETRGYSKDSDGSVALNENPTPAFVPSPENRWGFFVTGSGDFVNVGNHDINAHGYDITTGNVIVGADYRVCDHFAVGIDGSYAGSRADLVDRGRVEVDGGKAGAYATLFGYKILGSVIHIDGAVSGGWNSYDTHRTGLEDLAVLGSTNGSEFNAMLAYGGDWHFGCLLIGTWSSLQYTNVSIDSFTETGSLAPLHIESQDQYSLRGTTGLRMAYDFKAGRAIVRPEVRAAYQHEYGARAYPIDASLASGAGDVFTVHGPKIGRDSALVDAGFAVQWTSRFSTYVYYDGVLGRSNYDNHAVSGGCRISF